MVGVAGGGALTALARSLSGDLVTPRDEGYDRSRRMFNARFDGVRPSAIAYPEGPADIAECLSFARIHDVRVAVRSGGHSYAGWSTGEARIVIDLARLPSVFVDGDAAVIGAGARLGDVYEALGARGRVVPAGTCPSVGISGLTLGGGHGVMTRAYGLACDNLTGVTLVAADGRVVECDREHEAELFWALRGAGNGNFGVVTDLRFTTHSTGDTVSAELAWPWAMAPRVVRAWQENAPEFPEEIWAGLRLERNGDGEASVSLFAFSLGDRATLENALDRLPGGHSAAEIRTEPHLEGMRRLAGDDSATAAHVSYDVRTDFIDRSLVDDGVTAVLGHVERGAAGVEVVVALVPLGGAVNRMPRAATAFVHRGHRFLVQYEAYWDGEAAGLAGAAWLREVHAAMRPHASGEAYQNVPDPLLGDWRRAYYGEAADRLADLKKQVDPERIFDFPHAL